MFWSVQGGVIVGNFVTLLLLALPAAARCALGAWVRGKTGARGARSRGHGANGRGRGDCEDQGARRHPRMAPRQRPKWGSWVSKQEEKQMFWSMLVGTSSAKCGEPLFSALLLANLFSLLCCQFFSPNRPRLRPVFSLAVRLRAFRFAEDLTCSLNFEEIAALIVLANWCS
jgi:hypothetical protein